MKLPKVTNSQIKGWSGEQYFMNFVLNEMRWIPQKVEADKDYGLDCCIEIIQEGYATGKRIMVQIKHGNSYFVKKTLGGYKFIGELRHLNYYANCNFPVFIVILDEQFENKKFVQFKLEKTMLEEVGKWWMEIPEENNLDERFKEEALKSVGDIIDYSELMEKDWIVSELLQSSNINFLVITKEEVEREDFSEVFNYINVVSRNKQMLIESRNILEIAFPEYIEDSRELFEIPEVVHWMRESIDKKIPWLYFLNCDSCNAGLYLLMVAYCCESVRYPKKKMHEIIVTKEKFQRFLDMSLCAVNKFAEENKLDEDIILEVTDKACQYYASILLNRCQNK